jgi:hypothetical protein
VCNAIRDSLIVDVVTAHGFAAFESVVGSGYVLLTQQRYAGAGYPQRGGGLLRGHLI